MRGRLFQVCCSKVVAYSKRAIIRRVSGLLFIILEKNREKAQNFRHSLYLYEEVFKRGFITVISLCCFPWRFSPSLSPSVYAYTRHCAALFPISASFTLSLHHQITGCSEIPAKTCKFKKWRERCTKATQNA